MPVYNGEKYIAEALDSVLSQTYPNFELIISDNASEDRTQEICLNYCRRDPRIKYVRQKRNHGGHWNFNYVTQNAKGQLVTWLAYDDILEPRFLEVSVAYMSLHNNTVLASGDFKIIDQSGAESGVENLEKIRRHINWNKRRVEFFKYPISNVYFCIYGMMKTEICKSVLESVREPKVAAGSELPILARFAAAGEISSIPIVLRKYRRHGASMYTNELAEIEKKSVLRRNWIRIKNLYRLRYDQMTVLFSSSLSVESKFGVTIDVLLSYVRLFFLKTLRVPTKIIRILGG